MKGNVCLVVLILLLSACQEVEPLMTPLGTNYIKHTANKSPLPKPGEYIFFHSQIRIQDSIIHTSRLQGELPRFQLKNEQDLRRQPSPIEDVLRYMAVGDSVTVEIPFQAGDRRPKGFEMAEALYYDVVCLNIQSEVAFIEQNQKQFERIQREMNKLVLRYNEGRLKSIEQTNSGLEYIIKEEGKGPKPQKGEQLRVHYYGMLTNGELFDNSIQSDTPLQFSLGSGKVIKGWEEGLALLNKGSKAVFIVPPDLAYGETGNPPKIPAQATLVFYVELL